MGARVRAVAVVVVVLAVGAFLGSALSQWWSAPVGGVEPPAPRVTERVRVEVLNGGGRALMARAATERLRRDGFDVVFFGNAGTFGHDSSVVLDRTGHADWAREVAASLGIPRIEAAPDSNLYLDVSVVLGQDWEPPAAPATESAGGSPPWWDLRRFFRRPGAPASDDPMADPGTDPGTDRGGS